MQGEIFKETLRRSWREALYWAIGLAIFGMYVTILTPDSEGLQGYISLMEAMPPAVIKAIGLSDISVIATPEGFLGAVFFTYGVIMFSFYGIQTGLHVTANDEEFGAMNMLLALPVPRSRVVLERALAYSLLTVFVALGMWLGLALAKSVNPAVATLDVLKLLQTCIACLPVVLTVMGVTVVAGILIRRRNIAAAVAGSFVAASYMLNTIGAAAGAGIGETLQRISLFNYFNGTSTTLNGIDFASFLAMCVIAVALVASSVRLYERRDIS